uniref:Isovaleryl-CoA dehydrogenase n=1 Tax=Strigamia maritima TaxID=126957 RepID=T1JL54_STRMM
MEFNSYRNLKYKYSQLRKKVFDFAHKELAPLAPKIDKTDEFPERREFWKKLGKLGLLGLTVPKKYGGSDGSYLDHIIASEELVRACAAVGLSYGAHSNLCVNQINKTGNEHQKQKYLPKLCSGEQIGALAMSELNAGSDVISMKLHAELKGEHYVLNGNKFWITNGCDADVIVIYAKTSLDAPARHGFKTAQKMNKLGMRGSTTCELIFEDCKIPVENLIGQTGKGISLLMSGLDIERVIFSAVSIGVMQACCDSAFYHVNKPQPNGENISENQLIQAKIADMYTKLAISRSYLYTVARAADNNNLTTKDSAGVVLFCCERAVEVSNEAMQCFGAEGYLNSNVVGRYFRDAKLLEIGAGTSEIRRLVVGREINENYSKRRSKRT